MLRAPCAGDLMERMVENGIDLTIFFYNPNIHPKKEYEIRKNENNHFAEKMGIPFVDADYDVGTGSNAPRAWSLRRSAAFAARRVLICGSSAPRFMRMRTGSRPLLARSAYRAGRTWTRLMAAANGRRRTL